MEKKIEIINSNRLAKYINNFDDYVGELVTIESLEKYISEIKLNGSTHIQFKTEEMHHGMKSDIELQGCWLKEESEEDFNKRVLEVNKRKQREKGRRKTEYLRLKAEFDK